MNTFKVMFSLDTRLSPEEVRANAHALLDEVLANFTSPEAFAQLRQAADEAEAE